jgi:GT2 family glycosyltransferase
MGALHILGVDLGSNFLNAADDNPKGFFENNALVRVNEHILESLGSSWDDPSSLPERWWMREDAAGFVQQLCGIIREDLWGSPLLGIKDPRIGRLLPLWKEVFRELSIQPCFIIPLRNPLEVARSLQKRDGFSIEKSCLLWLSYMLDAEVYTRGYPRVLVRFEDLLSRRVEVLKRIVETFGLSYPVESASQELEKFLDPGLRHHEMKEADLGNNTLDLVADTYNALISLSRDGDDAGPFAALDAVRERYRALSRYFYNEDTRGSCLKRLIDAEEKLAYTEDSLARITTMPEWKLFESYIHFRDSLLPRGSRRRRAVKAAVDGLRNPKDVMRKINERASLLPSPFRRATMAGKADRYDVIIFSIAPWSSRHQRSRQMASNFAKNGHRVFYLSADFGKRRSYGKKLVAGNICTIILPAEKDSVHSLGLDDNLDLQWTALKNLVNDFAIRDSVAFVELPIWYPLVKRLKSEAGSLVVFDCLDEFPEFRGAGKDVGRAERLLQEISDVCFATSAKRQENLKGKCRRVEIVRDAAGGDDWDSRFRVVSRGITSAFPKVSIVMVTYNNLQYTRMCLESIFAKTGYPNYEIIIVDNASTDGTQELLRSQERERENIRIILNNQNEGFAAATNRGIRESTGDFLILLNNDTVVTRGWMTGLLRHLKYSETGMVGPVTNSIGNEAKINVEYTDISDLDRFADRYTRTNRGKYFEIPVLAMFCLALRKETAERIGPLDERFSVGMFEDDDYSLRARQAGMKVICAEDVFIHHFGGAAFSSLPRSEYFRIFEENRTKFEQKWQRIWEPHKLRNDERSRS